MNTNQKFIGIYFLILVLISCQNKDDSLPQDCFPSEIDATISVTKSNINCEEIDIIWDISFGVDLTIRADSKCIGTCTDNTIQYTRRVLRKHSQGVDTLKFGGSFHGKCGSFGDFGQILNTKLGEPQEFFIGDTIVYEIKKISVCPTPGLNSQECGAFNFIPIEHPVISDYYILNASDFCN